jgi:hypothetical protein
MAIYRLIANGSFGPVEIKAMTAAYGAALVDLGLAGRDDPITEISPRPSSLSQARVSVIRRLSRIAQ